jgi:putative Ca2+/H+ antiporter (TMEM165/GDT1 family)
MLLYWGLSAVAILANNGSNPAVVLGAAVGFDVATGVAVAVGLVEEVQPLIETRTRHPIKNKGNAYLSGVLLYRFIIPAIGFVDSSPP